MPKGKSKKTESEAEPAKPAYRAGTCVIVGRPNVGKSTLLNLYVGAKVTIVSDKPQTTRRVVRGILTRPDVQVVFVDTPGIHRPIHPLGKYMVRSAVDQLDDVDVVVFLVDGSRMPTQEDEDIADMLNDRVKAPVLLALNKMDLVKRDQIGEITQAFFDLVKHEDWMRLSATKQENTDKLLEMIIARLPEGPPLFPEDEITDMPMQYLAAELVREQLLVNTRQEVPHSIAVMVDEWEDRSPELTYISATIWVEKDSQKAIVIGERGSMLKKVGQAARKEIEEWLGHKVYLELTVKVRAKWRRDQQLLRELGYE
ncbi:MAG TPA: GTPase Era [Anaerolineae bacterium]|nr:GTPase Era [Anaerolineae bacterium]